MPTSANEPPTVPEPEVEIPTTEDFEESATLGVTSENLEAELKKLKRLSNSGVPRTLGDIRDFSTSGHRRVV